MENEVIDRRVTNVAENKQASDTLGMLTRVVKPAGGEGTLKVRLPPIFVIMPPTSYADN